MNSVPNIDVYGKYARASCLADYLELLALRGRSMTRAGLQDFISDCEWQDRLIDLFGVAGESEETTEDDALVVLIHDLIEERGRLLGPAYPFQVDEHGRLRLSGPDDCSYVALLAITTVHAYRLPSEKDVKQVFEDTVNKVMQERKWLSVNFGAERRGAGTFSKALLACEERLRVQPVPSAAPVSRFAQDAGVDCIVHIPWCVDRVGRWTYIGQVTCAESGEWGKKICEPSENRWMHLLGEVAAPRAFLAVPHHVEPRHRRYLLSDGRGLLLDRLSIVARKKSVTAPEREVIAALASAQIEGD